MTPARAATDLALSGALLGTAGWALENVLFAPRYSALFRGRHVPFLPVYAIGGSAAMMLAPHLKKAQVSWPLRAAAYAALLSGIEYVGCQIDRRDLGACSWDYSDQACAAPRVGCIDIPHALLWGAFGLLLERVQ